ncbi:MAG TPA: glycosyltransferase N-terminal domain-containing protein [Niabella sp.]|nr:glycosyltransferase N-terminal domain-containing protein [Niabella sp.]
MDVIIYNIFLRVYQCALFVVSLFNKKAQLWVKGRKDIFARMENAMGGNSQPVIWMHCASLGEFEQGRPVLERLKEAYPGHKILLTFFSPSGYEIRKNYPGADWIFYLPLDTKANVKKFLEIVNPGLVIFVKYEYWYNYLSQLHKKQVPVILVSAIFRENAVFFKWYGSLHRKMLHFFSHLFVQNEESLQRLQSILPAHVITLAGDTRFDRVAAIANAFEPIPAIEKFTAGKKILVAGSTWPEDEKNLKRLIESTGNISLIIAPHEINEGHLQFLNSLFPSAVLYSELSKEPASNENLQLSNILIIDNIGMLSKLYKYSIISYIGGGFNKSGIHNTLEAAVYGRPVIFGPNYGKFAEAIELIKKRGAFSYYNDNEFIEIIKKLINSENILQEYSLNAGAFVAENTGATDKILSWLKQISF